MTNLELFDGRGQVLAKLTRAEQSENLERVSDRIGRAVIEFFDLHAGQQFHADVLRLWVETRCGKTAPGSADRVMRNLRARGEIGYELVSRPKSLYRCLGVT